MDENKKDPQRHLTLLFGLPACGKSSLARKMTTANVDVTVVEADDCLQEALVLERGNVLEGGTHEKPASTVKPLETYFTPSVYHLSRRTFKEKVRVALLKKSKYPLVVIAVDNMPFRSMRLEMWKLVRDINRSLLSEDVAKISFSQLLLDASIDECMSRNGARNREGASPDTINPHVSPNTIRTMGSIFEHSNIARTGVPLFVVTVSCDVCCDELAIVFKRCIAGCSGIDLGVGNRGSNNEMGFHFPGFPFLADSETREQKKSLAHCVDLALRKVVSGIMLATKDLPTELRTKIGNQIATERRRVLCDVAVSKEFDHAGEHSQQIADEFAITFRLLISQNIYD